MGEAFGRAHLADQQPLVCHTLKALDDLTPDELVRFTLLLPPGVDGWLALCDHRNATDETRHQLLLRLNRLSNFTTASIRLKRDIVKQHIRDHHPLVTALGENASLGVHCWPRSKVEIFFTLANDDPAVRQVVASLLVDWSGSPAELAATARCILATSAP